MYDDDDAPLSKATWAFIITIVLLGTAFVYGVCSHDDDYYVTTSHEIWSVTAPFGVYYTDISGSFVFGCGEISSGLSEAYVVKYLEGGELKTISLDAASEYVHLTFVNDTHTLYIMEYVRDGLLGDVHMESFTQYYIQIPEPVI